MTTSNSQNDYLIKKILDELDAIKDSIPEREIGIINSRLENVLNQMVELKDDAGKIKSVILDHPSGVAFKVTELSEKMTSIRDELNSGMEKVENVISDINNIKIEQDEFSRFKANIVKIMWIVVTAVAGLIAKVLLANNIND